MIAANLFLPVDSGLLVDRLAAELSGKRRLWLRILGRMMLLHHPCVFLDILEGLCKREQLHVIFTAVLGIYSIS